VNLTLALNRLLLICPHPDDETIGAGLLLQEAIARGGEVRIVFLTDGERNPIPQFLLERHWPWRTIDRARWGLRRREEARAALRILGVPAGCAEFWGLPDQGVRKFVDSAVVGRRLSQCISAFQPDVLVTPSIHDLHPDHRAAAVIARRALAGSGVAALHLVYRVHGSVPERLPVWASPALLERQFRKGSAMQCHRTQLTASGRRMTYYALRPELFARWEDDATMPPASFRTLRRAAHVVSDGAARRMPGSRPWQELAKRLQDW